MKALPILSLLVAGTALASPDFVGRPGARHIDESLVASRATNLIDPWDDVDFALDSAALDDCARQQLDLAASWLLDHPRYRLVVEGHTDRLGARAHNVDLGLRRAEVTTRYLEARGIGAERIVEAVYGEAGAPAGIHPLRRRVVLWASTESREHLAAIELDRARAVTVAWNVHGTKFEESLISLR